MTGEQIISAPRARVWDALNDPKVLERCIPGCQEVDRGSEVDFKVESLAKIGPVRARFTGGVLMEDVVPGLRCRLGGEGIGDPAGFGRSYGELRIGRSKKRIGRHGLLRLIWRRSGTNVCGHSIGQSTLAHGQVLAGAKLGADDKFDIFRNPGKRDGLSGGQCSPRGSTRHRVEPVVG